MALAHPPSPLVKSLQQPLPPLANVILPLLVQGNDRVVSFIGFEDKGKEKIEEGELTPIKRAKVRE